jgi:hypothetical protein
MHTKVHEWLWQALQTASGLNPRVLLPHPHVASICASHGNTMPITNSTTGYQLYFALMGCQPGKQHYRYNTPHALRNSSQQLLCHFSATSETVLSHFSGYLGDLMFTR